MKKRFALAVIVITAIALSLVGCGVKVTNISVPDAARKMGTVPKLRS